MDKFQLKEKLVKIADAMDILAGDLMVDGCCDEEVAKIKSIVISKMAQTSECIHQQIWDIF